MTATEAGTCGSPTPPPQGGGSISALPQGGSPVAALPQGGDATSAAPHPGGLGWATPAAVLCRRWSDSDHGVVYDGLHARTHLLDGLACDVLEHCRVAPASLAALRMLPISRADGAYAERVLATVAALEVAGLLVRVPLSVEGAATSLGIDP